jgi:hypothetical protein
MVNRKRWADFVSVGVVTRTSKQGGHCQEEYACFSCPYQCGKTIELPSASVKNNKSTECRKHLLRCNGEANGRKASDDHRVVDARRAIEATGNAAAVERLVKRTRIEASNALDVAPPTVDTSSATELVLVQTALETERAKRVKLEHSETGLIASNDRLSARVNGLETQMETTKNELASIRRELESQNMWQKQILAIAGITAPPIPDAKTISRMIKGQELKEVDRFLKLVTPGDHRERMEKLRLMSQFKMNQTKFSGISMEDQMRGIGKDDGVARSSRLLHPNIAELKQHVESDAQVARYVKSIANKLPNGEWQDIFKECTPSSGNPTDETFNRSGTRHA